MERDPEGDDVTAPATTATTTQLNTRPAEPVWTPITAVLGLTTSAAQRAQIRDAAAVMTWEPAGHPVHRTAGLPCSELGLSGVTQAVAAAAVGGQVDRIRRVGAADMPGGRRLFGLHDPWGARTFLIADGAETVHVLVVPALQPALQPAPAGLGNATAAAAVEVAR